MSLLCGLSATVPIWQVYRFLCYKEVERSQVNCQRVSSKSGAEIRITKTPDIWGGKAALSLGGHVFSRWRWSPLMVPFKLCTWMECSGAVGLSAAHSWRSLGLLQRHRNVGGIGKPILKGQKLGKVLCQAKSWVKWLSTSKPCKQWASWTQWSCKEETRMRSELATQPIDSRRPFQGLLRMH